MAYQKPQPKSVVDEFEFIDSENWRGGNTGSMTYENLVLQQIMRIRDEGSKEMVGGFFEEKVDRHGKTTSTWKPDQRQVYIQSINTLYDLLLPFVDPEFVRISGEIEQDLIDAKQNQIESLTIKKGMMNNPKLIQQINFEIATGFIDKNSVEAREFLESKLEIYRTLFQELLLLFNRQKFLMAQAISDD